MACERVARGRFPRRRGDRPVRTATGSNLRPSGWFPRRRGDRPVITLPSGSPAGAGIEHLARFPRRRGDRPVSEVRR